MKITNEKKMHILMSILLILGVFLLVHLYRHIVYTYINVQFKELRPFREKLEVYYKGYKIGRALKIYPSKDYKYTFVKIVLYPHDLKLPLNIKAVLKREKRHREKHDYIELIYPENPSYLMLKDGSTIAGKTTVDIESYLASQDPDSLDAIKKNLEKSSETLNLTLEDLGNLFVLIQDVIEENRPNIMSFSKNLSQSSGNFNQMSYNINKSLSPKRLDSSVSNIDLSTANIRQTTENLQVLTGNIDNTVKEFSFTAKGFNENIPSIKSSVSRVNCILANVQDITCGVSQTLKKRFGGMRILFGKAINSNCNK